MKQRIFTLLFVVSVGTVYGQQWDSLKNYLYFEWGDTCPPYHVVMHNYLKGDEEMTYSWRINSDSLTGGDEPDFVIADTGKYNLYCAVYNDQHLVYRDTLTLSFFCDSGAVYAGPGYYGCGYPAFDVWQTQGYGIHYVGIFDRWGELRYECRGLPVEEWYFKDASGNYLKDGTYFTLIKFTDSFGNNRVQWGDFGIWH